MMLRLKARFLVMLLASSLAMQAPGAQPEAQKAEASEPQFVFGPNCVLMPVGVFVLVRKGRETGAFRLTQLEKNSDGLGKSTYESYFQGDGTSSFTSSTVVNRTGEVDIKPMTGISHSLTWQPGPDKLWIGKWWFGCLSPNLVNMTLHFSENDEGFWFAPTSAHDVKEIDASDARLRWFRFDTNASVRVSISDLPK
jgi:hypothetical protein